MKPMPNEHDHIHAAALGVVAIGVASLLMWFKWNSAPWRVARLIRGSKATYKAKEYNESLGLACEAIELASSSIGPTATETQEAMLHLAGVFSAMNKYSEASAQLDELLSLATSAHGERSLALLPVLHARAEVFEGQSRYKAAIEQLEQARGIRREQLGADHLSVAQSAFNLAGLLARSSQEGLVMSVNERAALVRRCADAALDGCTVATSHGEDDDACEVIASILQTLVVRRRPPTARTAPARRSHRRRRRRRRQPPQLVPSLLPCRLPLPSPALPADWRPPSLQGTSPNRVLGIPACDGPIGELKARFEGLAGESWEAGVVGEEEGDGDEDDEDDDADEDEDDDEDEEDEDEAGDEGDDDGGGGGNGVAR